MHDTLCIHKKTNKQIFGHNNLKALAYEDSLPFLIHYLSYY